MQNKSLLFKILIPTFFCCLTAGPYVVVENYGNWKTLSVTAKSAYVIGLWDGFITFFEDDLLEKYNNSCSKDHITRVSDLVEVVDSLYEQEINRGYSPAILLREKGLQHICSN